MIVYRRQGVGMRMGAVRRKNPKRKRGQGPRKINRKQGRRQGKKVGAKFVPLQKIKSMYPSAALCFTTNAAHGPIGQLSSARMRTWPMNWLVLRPN
jgi:hypothetical protein